LKIELENLRKSYQKIMESLRMEGSFVRNSAWMFTSSGVSILIQFVFFTILARIYSPEVYGIYGIFNLYVNTLGNASTLGYHQAFVIPKDEREFSSLLRLTLWIALIFSVLVSLFTLLAGREMLTWFHHEKLGNWVYWIGPTVFLLALDRITSDWAIRNKEFRKQTLWSTTTMLVSKIFNACYGFFISATVGGLVFTTLMQHGMRSITYAGSVIHDFSHQMKLRFSRNELMRVAREYKEFPLYIYWGNVINIFSNNLPAAMLLSLGFGIDSIGFYAYSLIVLDLPIRMLGAGIYSVFSQKAAELARERMHELASHTWRLYQGIVLVSLFFSLIVFAFGERLYLLLLDDKWQVAGQAAEVLVIFYFFRMISSPLSSLFTTLRKEKQFFIFQVFLTVLRYGALVLGAAWTDDFISLMWVYTLVNAVAYFVFCIWIFRLINFSLIRVVIFTLGTTIPVFLLGWYIKTLLAP
jgi:O-antigen/teichoic acid export membrane protein